MTPYEFTVDKLEPTATITAEPKTWDKLLEVLTFGLYSKDAVKVSAMPKDETSPIESVEYYKTDDTKIMSFEALEAVTEWTDITADCEFMTIHHLVTGVDPRNPPYETKPICQINPTLPKGLEYIISKCTEINPDNRYQSCDELMADLNNYMNLPKPKGIFGKLFGKK